MKLLGVAATVLGGLALANRALARRIERDSPPTGRFVTVDGCRLHYVDDGAGQQVVLLHGASGSLDDMLPALLPAVSQAHHAFAFDRPGHGYSARARGPASPAQQAVMLRQAFRALGIERPILVGHSWSGALVLAYALAWPDEIAGVVTVAGVSHPWTGDYDRWYTKLAIQPVLGPLFRHTVLAPLGLALIDAAARHVFAPEAPPPGYAMRAGARLLLRPDQFHANADDLLGLNAFLATQSARYGEIRVPVAIVAPSEDRIASTRHHSGQLAAAAPRARLFPVLGAGHMPHHTRPDVVVEAIRWVASAAAS